MKKLSRFVLALSFSIVMSLSFIGAKAESSGKLLSPKFIPGTTVKGASQKLKTSKNTVMGSDAGIYFTELGYLENVYSYGERSFPLYLKEQDYLGSDDDIKRYEVWFSGSDYRKISRVQYVELINGGEVEAKGDSQAELYLSGKLQRLDGDPTYGTNLFYYEIVLN